MVLIQLMTLTLIQGLAADLCPNKVVIDPCVCRTTDANKTSVYCGGDRAVDLSALFRKLSKNLSPSQKHFDELLVNNTAIGELIADTFADITFDRITIDRALSLSRLDARAFAGTAAVTKYIKLNANPMLSIENTSGLCAVLGQLSAIKLLDLSYNVKIPGIPANCFSKRVANLTDIYLRGQAIKTLTPGAFKNLPALTQLFFTDTNLTAIPDNAFAIDQPLNTTLNIDLEYNRLLSVKSFTANSFANIGKPAKLWFGLTDFLPNQYPYWPEGVFERFLNADDRNVIDLWKKPVDCQDCRNYWLKTHPKLLDRVANAKCTTGLYVNDQANFKDCV